MLVRRAGARRSKQPPRFEDGTPDKIDAGFPSVGPDNIPPAMTDGFNLRAGPAGTRALLEAVEIELHSSDQGVIAAQCPSRRGVTG